MRPMIARLLLLSLASLPTLTTHASAQARPTREAFVRIVDSLANSAVREGPVAGLGIAVVRGRDTLVMKGYGLADVENDIPVTPATVFRIGSVTKQFTAAAVMQLVDQGKLGLDDDITKHLPTLNTHGRKVLVRHLLNHTSGIPSYTDVGPAFGQKITLDLAHDSLLAIVAKLAPQFDPGAGFYYNNTGYYLLGMLIEKVSGKSYGDHLSQVMLKPIGINNTMYCGTRPLIRKRSQGYERGPSGLQNAAYMSMNLPGAAGALCSTIGDLVGWSQALHAGKIVSQSSLAQMINPVKLPSARPMSYGFGLGRDTLRNGRLSISHGGGINGFISQLSHFPQDTLTIAVLANTSPAPASPLAAMIANAWYGLPLRETPVPPRDVAMTAADRTRFVGNYEVIWPDGVARKGRVHEEGEQLMFTVETAAGITQAPGRLRWQGGNEFASPMGRIVFDVAGNRVTGFYLARGARPFEARRVP